MTRKTTICNGPFVTNRLEVGQYIRSVKWQDHYAPRIEQGWRDNKVLTLKHVQSSALITTAFIVTTVPAIQAETAHRVGAVLLGEESSLHTSVSNRDVYQLRVTPRHGAAFNAIAIDSYPGYAAALPFHRLAKDARFSVKLIRTPYCDQVIGEDLEPVRCFAIERGSWRGPKNPADEWWK